MSDTIMSVLMLTGAVLTGGAIYIFRKGDRRRALLMLVAAVSYTHLTLPTKA